MKKKTSRPAQSPTRFLVPAIIGMLLVMSVCAVWNASGFDLLWIFGTFGAAILITMAIVAPQLLPIEDDPEERRKASEVFRRFLSGSKLYFGLVRNGKVQAESKPPDVEDYPVHGVVVADSTSIVALRTATGTSRVEGPYLDENGRPHSGVIFTVPEEEIDAVIDLRPQLRRTPTKAQTRDGITVDVAVIAFYTPRFTRARKLKEMHQLSHPSGTEPTAKSPRPVYYPPPFAWRRASMIQALNSRRIERAGERTRKTEWGDRIMEIAIPRLRDLISEYTVDELTAWSTTDKFPKHPRYVIRDQLREIVTRELDVDDEMRRATGIELRFMSVSPPMPPDEVIQRRIQAWVEEWRKKEADIFAQADAEAMLTRELARAQVQGEMTARINDIFQEARAAETPSGDLVVLRFLEAMDKMAGNPMTRALLPYDSMKMLKQLRELLAPDPPEQA
jgi:regulator of protease activity HflC (stomatin/prohibitin superfamily)